MSIETIVEAVAVTAELTGTQFSAAAMKAMALDLMADHSEAAVLQALTCCRRELSGRLTLSAVLDRIDQEDGRPRSSEAWGIAVEAFDEAATVVLNDEIGEALAVARPVMDVGDEVGARAAFREAYDRVVRRNRSAGVPVKWFPSLGHDPELRVDAIQLGQSRGRLTRAQAATYLPEPMSAEDQARGAVIAGLLTGNIVPLPKDPEFKAQIRKMLAMLKTEKAA